MWKPATVALIQHSWYVQLWLGSLIAQMPLWISYSEGTTPVAGQMGTQTDAHGPCGPCTLKQGPDS